MNFRSVFAISALVTVAVSQATSVAVFADGSTNPAVKYLAKRGYDVKYVTDEDIASGYAGKFDVLFYTRSTASFGSQLSEKATAQVKESFRGNSVALFDDLTDIFINGKDDGKGEGEGDGKGDGEGKGEGDGKGDGEGDGKGDGYYPGWSVAGRLLENSINYAAKNKGIVGEFNGAGWLVEQGYIKGKSLKGDWSESYNPHYNIQPDHAVMKGIDKEYKYSDGADWTWRTEGIDKENVLAYDVNGNVSIAYGTTQAVPEPMSMLALAGGVAGLLRRRKNSK